MLLDDIMTHLLLKNKTLMIQRTWFLYTRIGIWCLTPLSTIFYIQWQSQTFWENKGWWLLTSLKGRSEVEQSLI